MTAFPPPDPDTLAPGGASPPTAVPTLPPTSGPGPSLPPWAAAPGRPPEPPPNRFRRGASVVVVLAVLAAIMVLLAAAALPILQDDGGDAAQPPAATSAPDDALELRPQPDADTGADPDSGAVTGADEPIDLDPVPAGDEQAPVGDPAPAADPAAPEPDAADPAAPTADPAVDPAADPAAPAPAAPEPPASEDGDANPAGSDGAPEPAAESPGAAEVPESKAVVRNGQIFLEGAVPTAEAGQLIANLAAEILGPDNVFNNYIVDPRAGDPNLGNVTVEDTINFATESSEILPEGEPLLNQALALMTIRPSVTVTIVGHTDSRGTDEYNLELSRQRALAVKTWLTDRGIDGDRLTTVGKGESEPIADDSTPEGRRLNRRIQFFIENLLADS